MWDFRKPVICTSIYAVFMLLFALVCISEAAMPSYQRLSPITTMVNAPMAVAVDSIGNIYVTESLNNKLLVYSQSMMYKDTLLGLNKPKSVAVDNNGRIFIGNHYDTFLDKGNVEVYDADLEFLFKLGNGDDEFSMPFSIAIDNTSGNVYVVDMKDNVVKVFDTNGVPVFSFDGTLNGGGQFHEPTSIIIDSGEIIVLDQPLIHTQEPGGAEAWINGARVQFFDMNGAYKNGFNRYGNTVADLHQIADMTTDNEGRIYISDTWFNVVKVYDRSGGYLGVVDDDDEPFRGPVGITANGGNILYVASLRARRVEVYGITPYALMEVDTLSLSWEEIRGASPSSRNVQINNNGNKTIGWTAVADSSWITLSDTYGTVGSNASASLSIGLDLFGLQPGSYYGSVDVSAESSLTETINIELTLSGVPSIADPNGPYSAIEGETVVLDGSGSSGMVVLYEWDIDDNGIYDYISTQPLQNHIFTNDGTYTVRLRTTDDFGAKADAPAIVTVLDTPPSASFTSTPAEYSIPYTVDFTNASTGYDQPLTYEWDFDNDEVIDLTETNPSYVYDLPGTYTVKLIVTDSDGSEASFSSAVTIYDTGNGCGDSYVKSGPIEDISLQVAYDASNDGALIMARKVSLSETVIFDGGISVTVSGGHNCDYSAQEGKTVLNGNIIVSDGVLVIEDFILE